MPVTRISAEVGLLGEGRRVAVDRRAIVAGDRAGFVHRLADDVHDPAEGGRADRHGDRAAGVDHVLAARQAFGGVHGDGAHRVLAEVLRDFQHQAERLAGLAGRYWWSPARSGSRGRWPANSTSTTAPMTWVISPWPAADEPSAGTLAAAALARRSSWRRVSW